MDRQPSSSSSSGKPSFSQQLLRSFRPRASTTAAPFTTSATASPISTPIDHAFTSELGINGGISTFNSAAVLDENANLLANSDSFTINDYQAYINELRQPIVGEVGSEQEEKNVNERLSRLHVLIYATNKRIQEEQAQDEDKITEREVQQIFSTSASFGPPQAEVFKMCLHLLLKAKEGLLPLSLRLGVCELATASVKLSDIRAIKGTKAVRETRSGAPGSQSSKVADADHPLANIDRAALYDLVCHLSNGYETAVLTKENWHQSQLPALPVQLRALEVLSLEGRDVVSFPGILDFLSQALEIVWKELQILRRLSGSEEEHTSGSKHDQDNIKLVEQLSAREWSVVATLQLITSIIKCGFAMLDLAKVETVLSRIAGMLLGSSSNTITVTLSPRLRAITRGRSKSREKKPITEGYDYYGLESVTPMNHSRSASPTPKAANTPKLGAKVDTSSVAPIALTTLAPAIAGNSLYSAESSQLQSSEQQPLLQTSDVRAVLILIDTIIRFGSIPSESVESVTKILCCILAYPDPLLHIQGLEKDLDWTPLLLPVLQNLLKGHCANASIRYVRNMLVNSGEVPNSRAIILVGAVDFLRNALLIVARHGGSSQIGMSGSNAKESALAPLLSLQLLSPALEGALQRHMDVLDLHVLRLVSDMLPLKDVVDGKEASILAGNLTPDDWDSLLNLTVAARRHTKGWKLRGRATGVLYNGASVEEQGDDKQVESHTSNVVLAMLNLVSRLRLGSPNVLEDGFKDSEKILPSLPWTPKLAALLLSLAPLLPGDLMEALIQYYKSHDLCLPCTPDWINNIRALLTALFHRYDAIGSSSLPSSTTLARRSLVSLIFEHVYEIVQDFPVHRCNLMLDVILPLAQATLGLETDEVVDTMIRTVLTEGAATAISQSYIKDTEEGDSDEDKASDTTDKDQRIFEDICNLFCRLARSTSTMPPARSTNDLGKSPLPPHVSFIDPPGSHEHKHIMTKSHSRTGSGIESSSLLKSKATKQCKSALNIITIINKLAFSSPWALLSLTLAKDQEISHNLWEKGAREACIIIFQRLLDLVRPEGQEVASVPVRLTILQWLVRLRTDRQHRIYLAENLVDLIAPAAIAIGRGVEVNSNEVMDRTRGSRRGLENPLLPRESSREGSERSSSRAERSISRVRDSSRDRGRVEQSAKSASERERSSSRQRTNANGVNTASPRKFAIIESIPLWRLPDDVDFEVPGARLRSDVVYSYTHPEWESNNSGHRHGGLSKQGEAPASLPISEYMATCISILTKEKDWDLVSYLLCHLPHQLGNKHLFCGPKAQHQIVALREMLANKILEQKFVNQVTLPDKIKSSDVYAIAYGTLSTLISYRALFSRTQQDELVEAFMAGLNKSSNTAQPCVRALSVCCYELQKSINRHLPKMLIKLTMVMSSTAMSVHILELIASIAQLPDLYANFTDTDFRRIFGIALQYIQYHNQDEQNREEDQISFNATSFTLAQYVLMLAYYNICLWFMSLRFHDRIKHVESIRKGLLAANQGKGQVSDQTEVCFDFLARFSYSNAQARPRQSYLNKIIKASSTSAIAKTYLFGKCLVTVASYTKFGGAEILVRRSSGTLALTCKVENAFASQLPDENGEKVELPATLMMNRRTTPSNIPAWTKKQLDIANYGVYGPGKLGLVKKSRPASFSGDFTRNDLDGLKISQRPIDAFSIVDGSAVNQEAELLAHVGSDHVEMSMKEVLNSTEVQDNGVSSVAEGENASSARSSTSSTAKEFHLDPGFIALQLSSFPDMNGNAPVLLPNEPSTQRLIRSIDLTPVVDFHKIGVLYVGAGQTNEKEILGNRSGSRNYTTFLTSLGDLITLKGQQDVYTGGLDIRNDEHGKFTYVWGDDISQIVYHVTTLMPNNLVQDENHSGKKALIGNDWVRIVWNESGREYDFNTIKTQFNFINIVISPNSRGGGEVGSLNASDTLFYRVSLQTIEGLPIFSPVGDGQLISASNLANFIRILALNSNLVSQIFVATNGRESGSPYSYTSNWVSRLQHIERAKLKLETNKEMTAKTSTSTTTTTTAAAVSQSTSAVLVSPPTKTSTALAAIPSGLVTGSGAGQGEEGESSRSEHLAYDIARF